MVNKHLPFFKRFVPALCLAFTGLFGTQPTPLPAPSWAASTPPAADQLVVFPPVAAHAAHQLLVHRYGLLNAHHAHLGLGATAPTGSRSLQAGLIAPQATMNVLAGTTAPASVDLSANDPPVGYQGQVNSCVAWTVDYGMRGWYAQRDGSYPSGGAGGTGSFEPMYTYAQIVKGSNVGTTFNDNLNIQQTQGVDTRADYTQGDYDYTSQPTASETSNAAHYKIASWTNLAVGSSAQQSIETALAAGNPVGLGLPVYTNFYNASSTSYYIDVPTSGMTLYGNHAVFVVKYDSNGVWVQNSWGTSWGLNGYAELSWAFVAGYVWQAVTMVPPSTGSTPTATHPPAATNTSQPVATATNTPIPVLTATNTPSATATTIAPITATATATRTPAPTLTATRTPSPSATATPKPVVTMTPTSTPKPHKH